MPNQKKDGPSLPLAIIAVALAATALIMVIVHEADDVKFVPRSENTTTTIVVTISPEGE